MFFFICLRVPFSFPKIGERKSFLQEIDHFNSSSTETFNQYYYVNLDYALNKTKSDTLLLYIGGEGPLSSSSVTSGSAVELAKQTKSVLLSLEHRFFGDSQIPGNDYTPKYLRFLTVEQALADLANFVNEMKSEYCNNPNKCAVGVIGGSYPGALSSWFRVFYPHLVDASWASSAPVFAKADFTEYDEHCANQISAISESCLEDAHSTFDYISDLIQDSSKRDQIMKDFGITNPDEVSDATFMYMLADVLATPIQYSDTYNDLVEMCENFKTTKTQDEKYNVMNNTLNKILVDSGDSIYSSDPYSNDPSSLAWSWMTCNQVGWFQTASGKLRSNLVDIHYFKQVCTDLFNLTLPDDDEFNRRFGGKNSRATSTYFTNGGVDPWSTMSIKTPDSTLDRYSSIIEGGHHCNDLKPSNPDTDSESLKTVRNNTITKMSFWLGSVDTELCGEHGRRVLNSCICDDSHGGATCEDEVHTQTSFRVVTIASVVVPTILLLIIGGIVWVCGKKEDSDFGARPALYT